MSGRIWQSNPPKGLDRTYLLKLSNSLYIDASEHEDAPGRYINDCRDKRFHNVAFDKRPDEKRAVVIAIRDIKKDDELFADYGVMYWLGWRMTNPDVTPVRISTWI
ncbi:hypothetical protein FOL47_007230 [Perkinsus chesapeaki]|uniref:SET domain-containing protein n=1 Tax=Perkinsus chesapeaki TaxID=330153 RepID=A0A7J6MWJ5_PERCH|nr:hypothetical protein FOL47_007230 [Perkinsus chesapeaki]